MLYSKKIKLYIMITVKSLSYNIQNSYLLGITESKKCRKAYKKDRVHPDLMKRLKVFAVAFRIQTVVTKFCCVRQKSLCSVHVTSK
jgi:hypothetical protein